MFPYSQQFGNVMGKAFVPVAEGLLLDGREAALSVDAQGALDYRPLLRGLPRRLVASGRVRSIAIECVHENDHFRHFAGDTPRLEHEIEHRRPRGAVLLVYGTATLASGETRREVMTVAEIDAARAGGGADDDWEEQARQTMLQVLLGDVLDAWRADGDVAPDAGEQRRPGGTSAGADGTADNI